MPHELDATQPFRSNAEVIDAMRVPDSLGRRRYDYDDAYRSAVEAKLGLGIPGVNTTVVDGVARGAAESE